MAKNKSINLLPQEEFDASVVGRVLKWAMGTFRIIVIVTEMIVMGAFLSRFWLDAQNSDLDDAVKLASAQIQAQSDFEKNFRSVQTKLDIFKQIAAVTKPTDKLDILASKVTSDMALSGVSIQDASAQIKGTVGSEVGLSQFLSNLKSNTTFKAVELGQVNSAPDNPALSVFTIKVTF